MQELIIEGGHSLSGEILISGSKNASLPILAATLLTNQASQIENIPHISDTVYLLKILESLGANTQFNDHRVFIQTSTTDGEISYDLIRKLRASVCLMGPLLTRKGKVSISMPGGCVIGNRPIDLHLKGFSALGAKITLEKGLISLSTDKKLQGTTINLNGPHGSTVLGTANLMMAATLAEGETIIQHAAREPEIVDLANFLKKMGAQITGAGTATLRIQGVESLSGVHYRIIADRIEATTYLLAGALVGQNLQIRNCNPNHLNAVISLLKNHRYPLEITASDCLRISSLPRPPCMQIIAEPYPGIPTDIQAQLTSLLCWSQGESSVEDQIFPQRFMHCSELIRMGAQIKVESGKSQIKGVGSLHGAPVMASDLRASSALVLAGLKAQGTTTIHRLYHLDRGYENLETKLQQVGAKINRVNSANFF